MQISHACQTLISLTLSLDASVLLVQLAGLRAERARWHALEERQAFMEKEAVMWRSRYHQAAARSDELASDVARIESELLATRLEVGASPCGWTKELGIKTNHFKKHRSNLLVPRRRWQCRCISSQLSLPDAKTAIKALTCKLLLDHKHFQTANGLV